jgi:hypothetical protein
MGEKIGQLAVSWSVEALIFEHSPRSNNNSLIEEGKDSMIESIEEA